MKTEHTPSISEIASKRAVDKIADGFFILPDTKRRMASIIQREIDLAVNSHDELLEALEELADAVHYGLDATDELSGPLTKAREVIAQRRKDFSCQGAPQ